jgi:hypothetical protein
VHWQQKRGDGELDGVPAEASDEALSGSLDEVLDAVAGESEKAAQAKGFVVWEEVSCTRSSSPGSPRADQQTTTAMELLAHEVTALGSRCRNRS